MNSAHAKEWISSPAFYVNVVFFCLFMAVFYGIGLSGSNADRDIYGLWKETEWKYEKVDQADPLESYAKATERIITEELKKEIAENLILHQGELWEFLENNKLRIHIEGAEDIIVDWRLKGRGQILKIIHEDGLVERYTIQRVNKHELVLNFYVEVQSRGIVKLTFKRM